VVLRSAPSFGLLYALKVSVPSLEIHWQACEVFPTKAWAETMIWETSVFPEVISLISTGSN